VKYVLWPRSTSYLECRRDPNIKSRGMFTSSHLPTPPPPCLRTPKPFPFRTKYACICILSLHLSPIHRPTAQSQGLKREKKGKERKEERAQESLLPFLPLAPWPGPLIPQSLTRQNITLSRKQDWNAKKVLLEPGHQNPPCPRAPRYAVPLTHSEAPAVLCCAVPVSGTLLLNPVPVPGVLLHQPHFIPFTVVDIRL